MKLKEESAISANFVEDVAVVKEKERERECENKFHFV
jgi:hypothetical protein